MTKPLLDVRDLAVAFDTDGGAVHAVNGVSYTLHEVRRLGSSASPAPARACTCSPCSA